MGPRPLVAENLCPIDPNKLLHVYAMPAMSLRPYDTLTCKPLLLVLRRFQGRTM